MNYFLRVWQECDIEGISKHLLIVGDLTGDCASCRELGINYSQAKTCPKCGTEFKFIALRNAGPLGKNNVAAVKRVKQRRPDVTIIDYDDYKQITGKKQARDFFK